MLSKSQYMRGRQCVKSLWLYRHRKDLIHETSPEQQMIFDQGKEIGRLARKRYPGGTLIESDHRQIREAVEKTQAALKNGAGAVFEAAVIFDNVLVRTDILAANKNGTWDLIEVKGATEVKDEYLPDLAVQTFVLKGAGVPVRKSILLHINSDYARAGEIDVDDLFTAVDLTNDVADVLKEVASNVKNFHAIVASRQTPKIDIGPHCSDPYDCDFIDHCWKHIPDYSIYNLVRISQKKIELLTDKGILKIKDIPVDFALTASQQIQVDVEKSGKPHIDESAIREFLSGLSYPLYFLDFETINPAIPPYDGVHPYQQIPFQCSIHKLETENARPQNADFLGDGKSDPRPNVIKCIIDTIGSRGTILAYNSQFENTRLEELADAFPKYARQLRVVAERLIDIAQPFRKSHFVHPKFRGSWSIKSVLPVLVPDMTYDNMAVAHGGEAQLAYFNLMYGKPTDSDRRKIIRDLRDYCRQDTLAMVKILHVLKQKAAC